MSGMTLAQKITLRDAYLAAEIAILTGAQSYQVGGRQVTKANLRAIIDERKALDNEITALTGGSPTNRASFGTE